MTIRSKYQFLTLGIAIVLTNLILSTFAFDNSVAQSTLDGTIPPTTDLVVETLTLEPTEILVNAPLTVTVVVRNVGETTVPGRRIYLYLDPAERPPISTTHAFKEFVIGISWPPENAMTVASAEFSLDEPGCGHTIYAWVDPLGRIAETNEDNNLQNIEFCVQKAPSLGNSHLLFFPFVASASR